MSFRSARFLNKNKAKLMKWRYLDGTVLHGHASIELPLFLAFILPKGLHLFVPLRQIVLLLIPHIDLASPFVQHV